MRFAVTAWKLTFTQLSFDLNWMPVTSAKSRGSKRFNIWLELWNYLKVACSPVYFGGKDESWELKCCTWLPCEAKLWNYLLCARHSGGAVWARGGGEGVGCWSWALRNIWLRGSSVRLGLTEFYYQHQQILGVPTVRVCSLTLEQAKTVHSLLQSLARHFLSLKCLLGTTGRCLHVLWLQAVALGLHFLLVLFHRLKLHPCD